MAVQRLRVDHSRVVEMSSKLVQERLDMEQKVEDMHIIHMNKVEQIRSRSNKFSSYQVEHLSGVGEAVIQDVKTLRAQFRVARQEVDTLEKELKEIETRDAKEKEYLHREKDETQSHEKLTLLLKYNLEKLEEEQAFLNTILQSGKEANNVLHKDRLVMERMARLVDEENRALEERIWEDSATIETVKSVTKNEDKGDIQELLLKEEVKDDFLEVTLGEKLCELESIQNCVEGSQKILAQMKSCSMEEEGSVSVMQEDDMVVKLEEELLELRNIWTDEQKMLLEDLEKYRTKVTTLEEQNEEKHNKLKLFEPFETKAEPSYEIIEEFSPTEDYLEEPNMEEVFFS